MFNRQQTNKPPKVSCHNQAAFLNTNGPPLPQYFLFSVSLQLVLCTQEGSHCPWEGVVREPDVLLNPAGLSQKEMLRTLERIEFLARQIGCAQRSRVCAYVFFTATLPIEKQALLKVLPRGLVRWPTE